MRPGVETVESVLRFLEIEAWSASLLCINMVFSICHIGKPFLRILMWPERRISGLMQN